LQMAARKLTLALTLIVLATIYAKSEASKSVENESQLEGLTLTLEDAQSPNPRRFFGGGGVKFKAPKLKAPKLKMPTLPGGKTLSATASTWITCGGKSDKTACENEAKCGWTGIICAEKGVADKAKQAFKGGGALHGKGWTDMSGAMNDIFKGGMAKASSIAGKLKDVSAAGLKDMASGLGAELKKGFKMGKAAMKDTMTKLKTADGFGAVSGWGVNVIEQAGGLLKGLGKSDLANLGQSAFTESFNKFGEITNWAKDQGKELGGKLMKAYGSAKSLTSDVLKASEGFLMGLNSSVLEGLGKTAFEDSAEAFRNNMNKRNTFDASQLASLKKQVKGAIPNFAQMTKANVEKFGSLLGTLDHGDLSKIPAAALKGMDVFAMKAMGGAKAAKAFTKDMLKELTKEARKGFNGADIKAIAQDSVDKLKAVLGCNGTACPGALVDFATTYDSAEKNITDVVKQVKDALKAKSANLALPQCADGVVKDCMEIMMTQAVTESASSTRRSDSGDTETVTRVYTSSANAADAAAVTGQGTTTQVDVGSGTTAGTTAAVKKATVTQTVNYASLDAATYTAGSDTKKHYECVYLTVLDTTYCTSATLTPKSDITISSSATAARRAGANVVFTSAFPETMISATDLQAKVTSKHSNFAVLWGTQFTAVNVASGKNIPTSGAATAQTATYSTSGTSALAPSLLLASVVALINVRIVM